MRLSFFVRLPRATEIGSTAKWSLRFFQILAYVRRFVSLFRDFFCDIQDHWRKIDHDNRKEPSGRDWARQLGINHTWLQKLVREFTVDPTEMLRLQVIYRDPTLAQLSRAQEYTRQMNERGELRSPRRAKC